MSPRSHLGEASLSPDQMRRVDELCNRFEAAWKAGQRPRIEDYLGDTRGTDRSALLHELIALEIECRQGSGEHPQQREYLERVVALDSGWLEGIFLPRTAEIRAVDTGG